MVYQIPTLKVIKPQEWKIQLIKCGFDIESVHELLGVAGQTMELFNSLKRTAADDHRRVSAMPPLVLPLRSMAHVKTRFEDTLEHY